MKKNSQIRKESLALVRGKWFWRMMTVMVFLQIAMQIVCGLVRRLTAHLNTQSWTDFYLTKLSMIGNGVPFSIPSQRCAWQMTGVSMFELFISYVFGAIVAFGYARIVLKAADNDEGKWFSDAMEGFRRPLESAWLLFAMNVRVLLWTCVCFVPGIIAVYRYRQAWYLKSENPEWSARDCITTSSKMMKGYKWQTFCLDLSFFGYFAIGAVVAGVAAALHVGSAEGSLGGIIGIVSMLLSLAAITYIIFLMAWYFTSRAVLYRAIPKNEENEEDKPVEDFVKETEKCQSAV